VVEVFLFPLSGIRRPSKEGEEPHPYLFDGKRRILQQRELGYYELRTTPKKGRVLDSFLNKGNEAQPATLAPSTHQVYKAKL